MGKKLNAVITDARRLKDKGFFKLDELHIRRDRFDGGSDDIVREVPERGDSVAILAFDPLEDVVILGRELRSGVIYRGEYPFVLSLPAGGLKPDEDVIAAAQREATEEMDLPLKDPAIIFNRLYNSMGGSPERISIVFAVVSAPKDQAVLGLAEEHENILRERVPTAEFLARAGGHDREMPDMMTTLAAQWLSANHARLLAHYKPA